MTLSHFADMIIVFSFIGVVGACAGNVAADLIGMIVKKIRAMKEKRKDEMKDEEQ